jgi:hypothetical protein
MWLLSLLYANTFLVPCSYSNHMVIYCTSSSNKCPFVFHKKTFLSRCEPPSLSLNAESLNTNKISEDILRKRSTKGLLTDWHTTWFSRECHIQESICADYTVVHPLLVICSWHVSTLQHRPERGQTKLHRSASSKPLPNRNFTLSRYTTTLTF